MINDLTMKEFLILRKNALLCSLKEWDVTIVFWLILILAEVGISVLKNS